MAGTVLLMMLSVASMLTVGLASNFQSPTAARTASSTLSHPVRTKQSGQIGALRGRITQWVGYFARSG